MIRLMLRLGEKQELKINRLTDFGAFLCGKDEETGKKARPEEVLLPGKELDEGMKPGDELMVFIYRDSKDRLIATRREPFLTLGKTAVLKVAEVTRIGAFLDWGLEKDLLLPFHEQTRRVAKGDEVLAALYIDKSSRLCATMKVYHYLLKNSPYRPDDQVEGRVYEISGNFGVFVAVDDRYSALIPKKEASSDLKVGDKVSARVTGVKEDGKLDISVRKKAYLQMGDDADAIVRILQEFGGSVPYGEKADPERIRQDFVLSKNAFKRALGRLLKEGRVIIEEDRISLKPEEMKRQDEPEA